MVTVFDQKIINEGRLHYIQSISNQSSDSFIFDVTNGISSLDDLVFHLTILPKNIYMETRDLVVTEGKDVTLEPSNVHVITDYFVDKINDYLIVDPPTGGRLVEVNNEGHEVLPSVTIFSIEDLEQQRIRVSFAVLNIQFFSYILFSFVRNVQLRLSNSLSYCPIWSTKSFLFNFVQIVQSCTIARAFISKLSILLLCNFSSFVMLVLLVNFF